MISTPPKRPQSDSSKRINAQPARQMPATNRQQPPGICGCRIQWKRRRRSQGDLAQPETPTVGQASERTTTTSCQPQLAATVMQAKPQVQLQQRRRRRRPPSLSRLLLLPLSLLALLSALIDVDQQQQQQGGGRIQPTSDNRLWPLLVPLPAVHCATHSASTPSAPVSSSMSLSPSVAPTATPAPRLRNKSRLGGGGGGATVAATSSKLANKQAGKSSLAIVASSSSSASAAAASSSSSGGGGAGNKRILPVKFIARPVQRIGRPRDEGGGGAEESSAQYQAPDVEGASGARRSGLQVSISPLVGEIRVPVDSNAVLKCLIAAQADRFTKKFDIHWSRYMYDENVYEQIESFSSPSVADDQLTIAGGNNMYNDNNNNNKVALAGQNNRPTGQEGGGDQTIGSTFNNSQSFRREPFDFDAPVDRQAQLREFLGRVRQETNVISEVSIEASLSISPVLASDNATYYCTATDGLGEQTQARIYLVVLSKPIVHLDRVRPARDSKSALIYWLVLSDGNTPIKKTILMVRNDTDSMDTPLARPSSQETSTYHHTQSHNIDASNNQQHYQQRQQFPSSVVIDSDHHEWQRIDILADGEQTLSVDPDASFGLGQQHKQANSPYSSFDGSSPVLSPGGGGAVGDFSNGDSVVRADVDVTSSSSSSQDDNYESASSSKPRWRHHGRLVRRQRVYNLTSLLPGITYQFRLAAINDMGQSNWTYLTATMPNEIPAQIQEVTELFNSTNSLAIGWKRPAYDKAKTLRYELQLFDLNGTRTLDANTNTSTSSTKTNFMYIFMNLEPGTNYHFHVRACSKAGCSAYSSPKLLARTLDGEADEPLDVELNCYPESGNITVSWMPPLKPRGQLTNYSVALDSYSRYQNQTGHWSVDEWRSQLDTPDNITLSLETGPILMPNTNYSVRVCANNRSKHCGKQSSLSARSQCSTEPQLPIELPNQSIQLKLIKQPANQKSAAGETDDQQQQDAQAADLLGLELPLMSRRNGTIDCVQVILIRLPKSFDLEKSSLANYLPEEPSDIRLSQFVDLEPSDREEIGGSDNNDDDDDDDIDNNNNNNKSKKNNQENNGGSSGSKGKATSNLEKQQQSNGNKGGRNRGASELAQAYLAEELDQSSWEPSKEEQAAGFQLLVLGDGQSQVCQSLVGQPQQGRRGQVAGPSPSPSKQPSSQARAYNQFQINSKSTMKAFDGSLRPQTYYTGFIKLIHIRVQTSQSQNVSSLQLSGDINSRISRSSSSSSNSIIGISGSISSGGGGGGGGDTGDSVSIGSLNPSQNGQLSDEQLRVSVKYSHYFNPVRTGEFVLDIPVPDFEQSSPTRDLFKLNAQMSLQEMASKLSSDLKVSAAKIYDSTASFVSRNVRLDAMGNFIMRSSPLVQLFSVAIIVLGLSLLSLFVIYLITLPGSYRRKRRRKMKRQAQLKQQHQQHQELSMGAGCQVATERQLLHSSAALEAQNLLLHQQQQQQQANGLEGLVSVGQQQQQLGEELDEQVVNQADEVEEEEEADEGQQQQQQFMSMQHQQQQQNVFSPDIGYQQVVANVGSPVKQQQQQHLGQLQQHTAYTMATATLQRNPQQQQQECPIHSSPLHRNNVGQFQVNGYNTLGQSQRSVPVHVCQPQQKQQQQPQVNAIGSIQHQGHVHAHQRQLGGAYATSNQDLLMQQQQQQLQQQQHYDRNCRTMRRVHASAANETSASQTMFGDTDNLSGSAQSKNLTLSHQNSVLALARKINKSIPLRLFGAIFECRLRNGWLKEEYEQLPRLLLLGGQQQQAGVAASNALADSFGRKADLLLKLRPQLIVSRNDAASALISGNEQFDASLVRMSVGGGGGARPIEKRIICAKSPLDADSVWDFWRLVYEQEVSTMVMLTQNEDPNTGEMRCAQYWPTCDNEETTILSPCNEYVQKSAILPAKFKIRQETLEEESREDDYRVRLLTLMVMATKPGENDQQSEPGDVQQQQQQQNGSETNKRAKQDEDNGSKNDAENEGDDDDDEKDLVIVERTILHLQFYHWNTSSLANQMRLIKFIEMANERHLRHLQQQQKSSYSATMAASASASAATAASDLESPSSVDQDTLSRTPMLVHCFNGLGRSGLFTAMSFIIDELAYKLGQADAQGQQQQQQVQKVNIFQLVSHLRAQREMLLSPYRLYELLYQLTSNCIPAQEQQQQQQQQLQLQHQHQHSHSHLHQHHQHQHQHHQHQHHQHQYQHQHQHHQHHQHQQHQHQHAR